MTFEELVEVVGSEGIFRTGAILAGRRSPADVRRQLDRWVKAGRVIRLRRGVYALTHPYRTVQVHPFKAANALRRTSYVSLQSALAHYGMIPEHVPVITSVTTARPEEVENSIGRFIFRHVNHRLFFGFSETEVAPGQHVLLAHPEKALVDLLYLTPRSDDPGYLDELRIEAPEGLDIRRLVETATRSGSGKVVRAVRQIANLRSEATA